ncbi:mitogen-activated protein kinase kinase kinase 20 [Andrographis paniculata]|uniref:mitogen-activated protein kinase kinase kinase 20 n=1 Tax=Andrographis paniculata TaxID=175694 RepID=UPI0021E73853|nr:mitogen-activated protein kinase kinase kinase 20 [Andrographis paniculata]
MDWIRGDRLGHGSFATVSLAVAKGGADFKAPLMAVKSCGASRWSALANEKLILAELQDCPEIIRCLGDGFSYENGEELYNVLLEYAAGGSLADRVRISGRRGLPEFEVRRYVRDLVKGLCYIHKLGYVHCDIKLQNVLLDSAGGVKIADFGLAKHAGVEAAPAPAGCELRGTPLYMSPEMVAGGEQEAPADVWAMGCAVSEMIAGSPAWRCSGDVAGLLLRIGAGEEAPEIPRILSEQGRDFLEKCFVKDPRKRWTAEMLLRHRFIDGQDFEEDNVTATKDVEHYTASFSPRGPFEFSDLPSPATCSATSFPSPVNHPEPYLWNDRPFSISAAERLRGIVSKQIPDWSVADDWLTVR